MTGHFRKRSRWPRLKPRRRLFVSPSRGRHRPPPTLVTGYSGAAATTGQRRRRSSTRVTRNPRSRSTGRRPYASRLLPRTRRTMMTPALDLADRLESALAHLRPDQAEIALHPAPIRVVACGRRYGKTVMAGSLCLAVAHLGGSVAWVVPTYRNARPVWRMAEAVAGTYVKAGAAEVHRAERTVTFRPGGWLGIFTAENT